jgi:hypothetical protein
VRGWGLHRRRCRGERLYRGDGDDEWVCGGGCGRALTVLRVCGERLCEAPPFENGMGWLLRSDLVKIMTKAKRADGCAKQTSGVRVLFWCEG